MVEQIRDAWNRMKTEQGFLSNHVSQSINIGVESLLIEEDRHRQNEVLHSSPEIVAKYTRITLLEIWYDYCRWSSVHNSLQELKALVPGGSTKEIRYHHVNILLALRDCLLRAAHTAYLNLGQLPRFKPYARFWWPNVSRVIIVLLFISRMLKRFGAINLECPRFCQTLVHSLRASQVSRNQVKFSIELKNLESVRAPHGSRPRRQCRRSVALERFASALGVSAMRTDRRRSSTFGRSASCIIV